MKISKIYSFLIFILFLVNYHFFFLIDIPKSVVEYINLAISVVLFIIYLISWNKTDNKLLFFPMILSLVIISFAGHVYSMSLYPQEAFLVLMKFLRWSILLLYFPLSKYIRNYFDQFIKMFTLINIIGNVLLLVQSFLVNNFSIMFLKFGHTFSEVGSLVINTRDGSWRFTGIALYTSISLLMSIYLILKQNEKGKMIHVINSIVSCASIYTVVQTRSMIITIIFGLFITIIILWFNQKKMDVQISLNKVLLILPLLILLFIAAVYFDFGHFISEFLEKNAVNKDEISFYAREGAIKYYWQVALDNPFFGNGAFIGIDFDEAMLKERGPQSLFYYVDVGISGNLGRFGFPILIPIFLYFERLFNGIRKTKNIEYSLILIVTLIQIVTTYSYFVETMFFGFLIILSISESQLQITSKKESFTETEGEYNVSTKSSNNYYKF